MNKIKLRRLLLEGMCRCAEEIEEHYFSAILLPDGSRYACQIQFIGRCPKAFKPGVSDKMLFNKIIDKVIENISSEKFYCNQFIAGINIMSKFYYPQFGDFDENQQRQI